MATSVSDLVTCNLQCPICQNIFVDPRLLMSCSHTYCKDCLKRISKSQKGRKITCPICRQITIVPKGNVDLLQCNQPIKSLIQDVKTQTGTCTVCRGNEKPLAITYCQECDDYMCDDCHKTHDRWDKFAGHEVVKVDGIISGVFSRKKRRKCKKHKSEDEECFCVECKRFVCFRCGMMEHSQAGHKVLDGKEHEDEQKEKIDELRGRADDKMSKIDAYIVFVEEQEAKMKQVLEKLSREIEQTCEESIQQLQEKRDHLIKDCTRRIEAFNKELQGMRCASKLQISQIKEVSELIENNMKKNLEGEELTVHETCCQKLVDILGKSDPDYEQPRNTTLQGERVVFQQIRRGGTGLNELDLGKIVILPQPPKLPPPLLSSQPPKLPPPPQSSRGTPTPPSSPRVPPAADIIGERSPAAAEDLIDLI
ncbi:E3 ubiquitin-protein ligase TRIM56-like [Diadema setosum]|uniref:E3 ubiquitin-protein ligase TRIM56-like n=1 Tax=Diadema setosum TaxID=31175 RepID=UPI003B3BAFC9